jgi:hypothetical protein
MRSGWNAPLSIFLTGALLGELFIHSLLWSAESRSTGSASTASSTEESISNRNRRLEVQYQRQLEELRTSRQEIVHSAAMEQAATVGTSSVSKAPEPLPQKISQVSREKEPAPPDDLFPTYEVLHTVGELRGCRTYGEVLLPSATPATPMKELAEYAKLIARKEGFDSMTLYRTLDARQAHYSMVYADAHPDALTEGLLGVYDRGRFKPHKSR